MKRVLIAAAAVLILFSIMPNPVFAGSFSLRVDQNAKPSFSLNSLYYQQLGRSRAKKPLIIVGASLLGGVYVASIVIDHIYGPEDIFDELYIPVVGPFLAIANYEETVGSGYEGEDFDKGLFLISGLLQSAGATMLIIGLTKDYAPDGPLYDTAQFLSKFSIAPVQKKGFKAGYHFNF